MLKPYEFVYQHDFDRNGALWHLATSGNQKPWQNPHPSKVECFASSVGSGHVSDWIGRLALNSRTHNEPYSFYGVDLGLNRRLLPTCYSLRNRNSQSHVLMNWHLEGSVDKVKWQVLDRRIYLSGNSEQDAKFDIERQELC